MLDNVLLSVNLVLSKFIFGKFKFHFYHSNTFVAMIYIFLNFI